MKKFIYCAILLLVIGCGKSDKTPENTIKFWHFWSEPNQKKALQELIAKFEKEHLCKVELTELSWNDGKTKLLTAFNSNVPPDVLELGSDWIAQFSSTGVLDALPPDSIGYRKFLEYSIPPAKWQNNFYAVPWIVDTRVLFYNKDLMLKAGLPVEPPATYQQLIEYSNIINQPQNKIYGFGVNGQDPHRLYKKILPIMWTNGGNILDKDGFPIINSVQNMEALNIYLQLSRTGIIETQRELDAYFANGTVGFVFSGAWLLNKIRTENPSLSFGVSLVPSINQTHSMGISFLGCEYLAISKASAKKELALKLIKYLTEGKNALEFSKRFPEAGFPAEAKYFSSPELLTDEYKKVFANQIKYSQATPVHPRWLDIESCIENSVTSAMYGETDAVNALNNAQKEVIILLGK